MSNTKQLSLICNILVVAIISMAACDCRVLQPNNAELIERTCKQTPNPNLCVKLLESDPRGRNADLKDLALIIVDVIATKAKVTLNKIEQLRHGRGGEKEAIDSCSDKYRAILEGDVVQATQALERGNPKFAESALTDSAVEATSCEHRFKQNSPLTTENNYVRDVANVATAIVRQLL
ncbi:Cell wall / vacuolar inhibitor of fructosidase 1, partial [Mucuna pruriens]